ncbi:MAG: hypothetical protein ACI8XU_000043 [Kiritimatiellia bacterium]|jgi:hypothetical protein
MNWEAIGAIGEIVGATGVIVTLIYLAVQIRQNTSATNRTNVRNVLESNNSALSSLLDESVSEIFVRGLKSLEGLNEVERYRFDNAFYQWVGSCEQAFIDKREGTFSADSIVVYENAIVGYLLTPGGKQWWEERQVWFSPPFRDDVNRLCADPTNEAILAGPKFSTNDT